MNTVNNSQSSSPLLARLSAIVGERGLITDPRDMEPYVVEEVARGMLQHDPALRAAFDAALAADPELAKSPTRRLEWFYQRSPAWDERVNLVPVYRTASDLRAQRR